MDKNKFSWCSKALNWEKWTDLQFEEPRKESLTSVGCRFNSTENNFLIPQA